MLRYKLSCPWFYCAWLYRQPGRICGYDRGVGALSGHDHRQRCCNGKYNLAYILDFWDFYAERYANESHLIFDIQNEPVAWGPPYSASDAAPPGAISMEAAAYSPIRSHDPDTPVLLFSYAVFGGTGGANAALTDIDAFNAAVGGNPSEIWSHTAVGFHGYAGWQATSEAVENLLNAGYPCFMTEFGSGSWGVNGGGFDVHLASELERMSALLANFSVYASLGCFR